MSQAPASSAGHCTGGPTVSKQFFGQATDIYVHHNLPVFRHTLANCAGMQVRILTYGGTIQSINVPNSPNQPNFPSTELKPGQMYNTSTIFQFSS
jgi:galactose mutarotase-like enzyme